MEVYDEAHALARAIRRSDAFRRLRDARRAIDADPKGKQMLDDLRRRQVELALREMSGQKPAADEVSTLRKLAEIASLHAGVREFLQAEQAFGALWEDVQKIVAEPAAEVLSLPDSDAGSTRDEG